MKRIGVALLVLCGACGSAAAETFYEVSAGVGQFALDITRKRAEAFADDSDSITVAIGAYRRSSDVSAWGAVVELIEPMGRDDNLWGSGRVMGFRPLNFRHYIYDQVSFDVYAGAARYAWRKTANGFYFGASIDYEWQGGFGLGLDAKYFQDLAHDSEDGDDIVDGFNTHLTLFYRFQ